jgi:predicted outer membrane repeat protein
MVQPQQTPTRHQTGRHKHRKRLWMEQLEDRRMLAVIMVDTDQDVIDDNDNLTSLREAILVANTVPGPDEIVFDFGHDGPATILLEQGELEITDALTITGDGPDLLTIDAEEQSRILNITTESGDFAIVGMTLTGGRTTGDNVDADDTTFSGGAIRSLSAGDLSVLNSVISGNAVVGSKTEGGGVYTEGHLTLNSSTVSGNSAERGGGGVHATGDVTVASSMISGNSATYKYGGGVLSEVGDVTDTGSTGSWKSVCSCGSGGGIRTTGNVMVIGSTISGNAAAGGVASGGGISGESVTVTSSTISGNSAGGYGGGISGENVTVTSSTIFGNSEGRNGCSSSRHGSGGIWSADQLTIKNAVVAGNTFDFDGSAANVSTGSGALTVQFSLIGDNTSTNLAEAPLGAPDANGNLIGGPVNGLIDPQLGPLADNGGSTFTHALLPASPALDVGDPAFAPPPIVDQRGSPRVTDGDADGVARIDMGAFEVLRGDVNGDGEVNGLDVDPFVDVLLNGPSSATADMNADGSVNGLDVDSFVTTVVGGDGQPSVPLDATSISPTTERSSSRLLPARHVHDGDDHSQLIHHRAVERVMGRRLRMHRSLQKDVVHQVMGDWQSTVERAFGDGADWTG